MTAIAALLAAARAAHVDLALVDAADIEVASFSAPVVVDTRLVDAPPPEPFLCPVCAAVFLPVMTIGPVGVCATCGATVCAEVKRMAAHDDLALMNEREMECLRKARGALARPTRK